MSTVIGYLASLVGAAMFSGLTWLLFAWSMPLWLLLIAWGAALPLYALSIVVYLGGFYAGWKSIFGDKKAE